jgi:hypothetical protein
MVDAAIIKKAVAALAKKTRLGRFNENAITIARIAHAISIIHSSLY